MRAKNLFGKKTLWISVGVVLCLVAVAVGMILHNLRLESLQNEALEILERDIGTYDEQSIVLQNTSKAKAEALAERFGARLRITANGRYATLTLPEGVTIRDVYALDEAREYIDEMSADYQTHISEMEASEDFSRLPARPSYAVSDEDYDLQIYLDYLNMRNVWESYTGVGITVAVIDTGIDTDHPEFAGRISEYSYNASKDKIVKDYLLEDGSYDWSLVEDEQGHGTAVTGVIAASMNSGNVVGIAPNVTILTIKADCDENGNFERTSDLVFGLYYAVERDVNVVNMSFGGYFSDNPFKEAAQLAFDSDVICVAAAGNDGTSTLMWPAADEHVIGVGALKESSWELATYSNYGENSDLVAPGTTYTTLLGGAYGTISGTSLASPVVTGAVALYLQGDKYATFDKVFEILSASCYDLGSLGNDWDYGFGALDVNAFLQEERGTVTFDMLTDELENEEALFIRGHALQELPEPERLYAVFDGWYYDDTFTQAVEYYSDRFQSDLTLYAKWGNEEDGIPFTYVVLDDGTVEIRSYTGHRRFITVPETIDGRVVSSIGDFAFDGQSRLREISLPSGLTYIGRFAFRGCSNLLSIEIPEKVKTIDIYAFSDNIRLSSVAFLGNSMLEKIEDYAFSACSSLEKIDLPASLTSVNGTAFFGTVALHTIRVNKGNTSFVSEDGVLFDFTKRTLVAFPAAKGISYTLPETVNSVGKCAFAYAGLHTVNLSSVQEIGEEAFIYSRLAEVSLPDSVITMGGGAFFGNANLSEVSLGAGIREISAMVFSGCGSLKEITVPAQIVSIGGKAFSGSGLRKIVFEENSSLVSIGSEAFFDCKIWEITFPDSLVTIGESAFSGTSYSVLEVAVFGENSQLRNIGAGAFRFNYNLTQVSLPSKLETVGDLAFANTGLTAVTVPQSVKQLGGGVFSYNGNLSAVLVEDGNGVYHSTNGVVYTKDNRTLVQYPAGKTNLSYSVHSAAHTVAPYAFAGALKLSGVTLPEGMEILSEYSFTDTGIQTVSLPSTLTEIQQYAFYRCVALTRLAIPDNVVQIGRYSVAGCRSLSSVTFSATSKLPRISFGAFAESGIRTFTVPANVSTMAQGAFMGCENLTTVYFAENSKLESISAYVFDGCVNLNRISFGKGSALTSVQAHGLEGMANLSALDFTNTKLSNVDNFAFRFCKKLTSVTFPETLTNVGRYAFYGCESLTKLTLPTQVEHIGSYAFLGTKNLDLYLTADVLPAYLDESWDRGIAGYYVGVTEVVTRGDYKYATLSSGGIAILEYFGSDTVVDLSSLNFGAPITAIGGGAFKDSTVTEVVLPETLTQIQAEAFQYAPLTKISIPASVTFIGREAFAHTDIASLEFCGHARVSTIEQYAFEGTESLTSVTLPASLKTLGTGVFLESGLKQVVFAQGIGITEIPQMAFAETKLTSVALPDSVTLVNHKAFNGVTTLQSLSFGKNDGIRLMSNAFYRTGLTSLYIPANVTYIGEYCFVALTDLPAFTVAETNPNYKAEDGLLLSKNGRKLISVPAGRTGSLTVPLSVEEIGFGAFEESKLSEVLFHENANILSLGYRAFFKANNLTTVTVPSGVVAIDYYAFAYCENLREVIFAEGSRLKGIYEGAFCGAENLESILLPDSIVEISDFAFYGCSKITKLPISATSELRGIYSYAFAYSGFAGEFTLPESVIDLGDYAFLGTKLTKVTIPDANKKQLIIGIGAFEDCVSMTEITLPFLGASYEDEKISWLGYIFGAGAYSANETYVPTSLKTVTLTEGITTIYTGGFYQCSSLETINIPHSVSALHSHAFGQTSAKYAFAGTVYWYESVVQYWDFGKGITGDLVLAGDISTVGYNAFKGFEFLTGISLPNSVKTIDFSAFEDCISLKSFTMPDSVTAIGSYGFSGCVALESVSLSENLEQIPYDAFSGCSKLTNIDFPNRISIIGERSFENCTSLSNIVFPKNLKEIKQGAFSRCAVKSIVIPESTLVIDANSFSNCYDLESVTVSGNATEILGCAFSDCTSLKNVSLSKDTALGWGVFYGCKNLKEFKIPENTLNIADYLFYDCVNLTKVTIPSGVISIGDRAFYNCGIKNVDLPDSVTSIGTEAFSNCEGLSSITLSENLTEIGEYAFSGSSLYVIENRSSLMLSFGEYNTYGGVAYNAKLIIDKDGNKLYKEGDTDFVYIDTKEGFRFVKQGEEYQLISYLGTSETITLPDNINGFSYTLYSFKGGKHVIIPESMVKIDDYAFYENETIVKITVSQGVTAIGRAAFEKCTNLTEIFIPGSVTEIGNGAFADSKALINISRENNCFTEIDGVVYNKDLTQIIHVSKDIKQVILPHGITSLGSYVFKDCTELVYVEIPDSVRSIGFAAFSGCSSLKSINIPGSVWMISQNAFYHCDSLKQVVISDGVERIESTAFGYCSELKSISIPASVYSISNQAFWCCTELTIDLSPDNAYYEVIDGILYNNSHTEMIHVSPECRALTSIKILDGVVAIKSEAFKDFYNLKTVILPESVVSINFGAFSGCNSLTSIMIPDSVTYIGDSAFSGCTGLTSVTIPDGVTSIGSNTFSGCSSLTSIKLSDSVTSIGYYAFSGCSSLTNVVVPDGVSVIQGYTFSECSNLTSITLPEDITSIGSKAFFNCTSLTNIDIPDGVTSLGNYAFSGCRSLISIKIPDGVTSIAFGTFVGCRGLKSITISDGVTSIGSNAFSGCSSLTSITIPESVVTIGDAAFYNVPHLYEINTDNDLISFDSTNVNGYLLDNARVIIDSKGNKVYRSGVYDYELIETEDGFRFKRENGEYTLIGYFGSDETLILPERINGSSYSINRFVTSNGKHITLPSGIKEIPQEAFRDSFDIISVTIPEGVTHIGNSAFMDCVNLKNINIPLSVKQIGHNAFANTALVDDPDLREHGQLIIDGWLFAVSNKIEYLTDIQNIRGTIGATSTSRREEIYREYTGTFSSNIETVYIPGLINSDWSMVQSLTLKNIVILNSVEVSDLRHFKKTFQNLSGVTIYVEGSEQDLRLDANFPGWNNGNRVVYGDDWSYTEFRDASGTVIFREPRLNSKIIVPPVVQTVYDGAYAYVFVGWDLDGDGEADSLPATSATDLKGTAIVKKVPRTHTVLFTDPDGTVYRNQTVAFGAAIVAPVAPARKGYTFLGWDGYFEGMIAESDLVLCALWKHDGNGHLWSEERVVAPTCIEKGYTYKVCSVCDEEERFDYTVAIGHTWGDVHTVHAATCTEDGEGLQTCGSCKESVKVPLPAVGHSFLETVQREATCTKQGQSLYSCENCSEKVTKATPQKPHTYVKKTATKWWLQWMIEHLLDVFFGYEGSDSYYFECSECGHVRTVKDRETYGGSSSMAACNHVGGDWTVVYEVSCIGPGVEGQYCTSCNELLEIRVYAPSQGHSISQYPAKDPTCAEVGWHAYEACSNCDYSTYVEIPKLGHDLTNHDAKDATCTEIGWNAYETCSRCDHSTYVEIPKLGHDLTNHDAKDATCTDIGWNAYETCSRCDHSTYREIPAKGHSYTHKVTAPTCTERGYTTHTCACGHSYVDTYVNAKGHSYAHKVTAPTCTERGYTTHTCACGHSYVDTYVNAKGHSYTHKVTAPTCTERGYTTHTCACGHSYVDSYVNATGHNYSHVITDPTCSEEGYTLHTCSKCGHGYRDSYTEALGHICRFTVHRAPGTTDDGMVRVYCSRCTEVNGTLIRVPKLSLADYTYAQLEPADCTQDGVGRYCWKDKTYGEIYFDVTVPKTGHSYTHTVVPPTAEAEGYTLHTCACGHNYKDSYVDRLPAYTLGDVMGDNEVNSDDAIYLLKHTLFPEMYPINQASDFDGNGELNSDDAIYLLKHTLFPDMYPLLDSVSVMAALPVRSSSYGKSKNDEVTE